VTIVCCEVRCALTGSASSALLYSSVWSAVFCGVVARSCCMIPCRRYIAYSSIRNTFTTVGLFDLLLDYLTR
jgi:hypothetical protein